MGWHLLPQLAADAPLLASVLAADAGRLDELTCTFPSTTPTSLVSLGTGVAPGEHGILGFTVKLPDSEQVLEHIWWRGDPPAAQWQPVPTWFERLRQADVSARAVLPDADPQLRAGVHLQGTCRVLANCPHDAHPWFTLGGGLGFFPEGTQYGR